MSHGLRADAQARGSPQLLYAAQAQLFSCIDDVVAAAFGSAKINKFVEIIHDTAFAHDLQGHDTAAQGADGEAIRTAVSKQIVSGFSTATTVHVLHRDGWITRDMLT